jgi:hypothetical protein
MISVDWFSSCFLPEVEKYLRRKLLPFKGLLIIDNARGHPESVCFEDKNVKVEFLSPNTTSLRQPLDQGIIRCVKAIYTLLVFDRIRAALDADLNAQLMECWKSFTIADVIRFIKTAMDELRPETVNAS